MVCQNGSREVGLYSQPIQYKMQPRDGRSCFLCGRARWRSTKRIPCSNAQLGVDEMGPFAGDSMVREDLLTTANVLLSPPVSKQKREKMRPMRNALPSAIAATMAVAIT